MELQCRYLIFDAEERIIASPIRNANMYCLPGVQLPLAGSVSIDKGIQEKAKVLVGTTTLQRGAVAAIVHYLDEGVVTKQECVYRLAVGGSAGKIPKRFAWIDGGQCAHLTTAYCQTVYRLLEGERLYISLSVKEGAEPRLYTRALVQTDVNSFYRAIGNRQRRGFLNRS